MARDLPTVKEIHDRAEALRVYCKKHGNLLDAHNRLAGVIAEAEIRIGKELRATPRATGGTPYRPSSTGTRTAPVEVPTLSEIGVTKKQSAEYQELADAGEEVVLGAIAKAGAEGREVSRRDIRSAAREAVGKMPAAGFSTAARSGKAIRREPH